MLPPMKSKSMTASPTAISSSVPATVRTASPDWLFPSAASNRSGYVFRSTNRSGSALRSSRFSSSYAPSSSSRRR